jgi:DKNYY family
VVAQLSIQVKNALNSNWGIFEMRLRSYRSGLVLGLFCIILLFSGCNTGYRKVDGKWSYVTWDEANGRRMSPLGADDATFKVLNNGEYAKDKSNVYYQGRPIVGTDADTFVLLKGGPYAKDKNHVYLLDTIVVNADPASFKQLEYPYARDKKGIYCGTLPMNVNDMEEFEVIQPGYGYISSEKNSFIERNKEYSYLKDYPVNGVIYSFGGRAKTKTEYFEGYKKK